MNLIRYLLLTFIVLVIMVATWNTKLQGVFVLIFIIVVLLTCGKVYVNATTE